jgi:hypothetical protein
MRTYFSCVVVAMMSAAFFACGGGNGPTGAGPGDGGTTVVTEGGGGSVEASTPVPTPEAGIPEASPEAAPVDHGSPSTTYPAFPPAMGQIQNNGGYVMKNPIIVAITWDSDPSQSKFDDFADQIGPSNYYKQTAGDYGVGPAVSGPTNHVHLSAPPPTTVTDTDLQGLVQTNAGVIPEGGADSDGGAAVWPAPTQDTIYAFFLAPGTSLNLGGDACQQGVGGYHDQVTAKGVTTAYAVVPSCNFGGTPTVADQTTESMSHEINEASSDPQPEANSPGYVGFTNDTFAFDYFQAFQDEDADACEFFTTGPDSSFYEEIETSPPFDYWVQRIWSNSSALAGHNPCVPVPQDVYFNVTPLNLADVTVVLPAEVTGGAASSETTKGYVIPPGTSGQFQVGFYSDAATSGPWKITTSLGSGQLDSFNKSAVTATIDKDTGVNGEKAWITVNVTSSGSAFVGEEILIVSTLGSVSHYMPVWIAGK